MDCMLVFSTQDSRRRRGEGDEHRQRHVVLVRAEGALGLVDVDRRLPLGPRAGLSISTKHYRYT